MFALDANDLMFFMQCCEKEMELRVRNGRKADRVPDMRMRWPDAGRWTTGSDFHHELWKRGPLAHFVSSMDDGRL
jgi:hypothetical protein